MSHSLNIIAFDVPYPPNYGGVIDVYYKLLWLKRSGVKIHLHCFQYGRKPSEELTGLCEEVFYYKRKTGFFSNLSVLPYTVISRRSKKLENNLLKNQHPILFEVLHTCYLLNDPRFKNRKKVYRHSNIEHKYYLELSKSEKSFFKKIYLRIEAWKLSRFESVLNHADIILAVNKEDSLYFREKYPSAQTSYLPSFHSNSSVSIKPGKGEYILFHGNLSISENYEAAAWLIRNVFSKMSNKVIVAGLNPPAFLIDLIETYPKIQIKESPEESEVENLIRNAHIHVLFTGQSTGLKLKLLNVLFKGRFILCNSAMLAGTDIKTNGGLEVADSADQFQNAIKKLMEKNFSEDFTKEREQMVSDFDNLENSKKLINEVFGEF